MQLCPLDQNLTPQVKQLFLKLLARKPFGTRKPIATRAKIARRNRSISTQLASRKQHQAAFNLATNRFHLFNELQSDPQNIVPLLISHFGSIFSNAYLGIGIDKAQSDKSIEVLLTVTSSPAHFSRSWFFDLSGKPNTIVEFRLEIQKDHLFIRWISSRPSGHGGKMIAATYNLAKALGIPKIKYFSLHEEARLFFLHMDAGRPTPEPDNKKLWTINVQLDE